MERYPVDLDCEQIVRWVLAERKIAPTKFKTMAMRETETRELPTRKEARLGDEEQSELSEVATVATLQIAPADSTAGWLLTITVEDEIGPRLRDDASGIDAEQEIGIDEFYHEFICPSRGAANVVAEVANSAAKERLRRLLEDVEINLHVARRG
ncbi:hypothetical protein [Methylosinus sp. KRF6]|uniref:hypothetical protein n=1 Tax=Methylosinus sp. KRF6 TaxID=2846853 RepID=UPI001C0C7CDF|nr:hypothetical protein [Methylosinus sp. KRF6]MBU3889791.1 hypothetical protein [Methylosinus sp. KRF6]